MAELDIKKNAVELTLKDDIRELIDTKKLKDDEMIFQELREALHLPELVNDAYGSPIRAEVNGVEMTLAELYEIMRNLITNLLNPNNDER